MERNGMYTRVIIILGISLIQPVTSFPRELHLQLDNAPPINLFAKFHVSLIQSFIISQERALIS